MKKHILTFCCAVFLAVSAMSQQAVVHENVVTPSMTDAYHVAVANFKEACTANKINMTFRTVAYDDNSYAHILPVQGTASLDADLFTELKAKIGADAFEKLVADLRTSVQLQTQSIVTLMPEHSHLSPAPDENYRMFLVIFPNPGKEAEMENVFMEWRNAFVASKCTENFNVYRIQYPTESGYVISLSAKNEADMLAKRSQSLALLGEENTRLFHKQRALSKKYYWKRGFIIPQLSYIFAGLK